MVAKKDHPNRKSAEERENQAQQNGCGPRSDAEIKAALFAEYDETIQKLTAGRARGVLIPAADFDRLSR